MMDEMIRGVCKKVTPTILAVMLLTGCDGYNGTIIDTKWHFSYADIEGVGTVEVQSWLDFEDSDMVQITSKDGTTYLTHSSNVILRTK